MREDKLTKRSEDFSEWYNQVILRSELADYAPVRGCMVVRPYGWALWENIQSALDMRFKKTGHVNAAFPLLIPKSFLEKEKEHVKGFSPELAVVTIGGGETLEEPLIVRPTSETIIGAMYAKWIQSYRDLPLLINQWGNVVRWELRTKLFLRTLEFYWQEGHTAHATEKEAYDETMQMLNVYTDFAVNEAAVPVIPGIKSRNEKFAGAVMSTTIEAMMQDKRALQSGTSHFLGQNFAKAFNIQYLDVNNTLQYAWTTSWGLSTRFIGAIIMTHGDDQGLILPPRLAPTQVIIIPIYKSDVDKSPILEAVTSISRQLIDAGIRTKIDAREELTPGYKFNDWEMRGVPIRIEIGQRDLTSNSVSVSRRDVPGKEGKGSFLQEEVVLHTKLLLDEIQKSLLQKATSFRDSNIHNPNTLQELVDCTNDGWAYSYWCEADECEVKIKELSKATTRCIPLDQETTADKCIVCGQPASRKVIIGKSY